MLSQGCLVEQSTEPGIIAQDYKIKHLSFFFFLVRRAARVADSKTSRTPWLVLAEHSRYLYAPIFLRTSSPYIYISI